MIAQDLNKKFDEVGIRDEDQKSKPYENRVIIEIEDI